MKVLVTGAAGFIGSHVVQALLERQFSVIAVDNLATGRRSNVSPKAQFYEIDITSDDLEYIFKIEQPDYVIHLAAQSSVLVSMEKPVEDCKVNLLGTLNILRFSNKYGIKRCAFASTAAVYGNPSTLPVAESAKLSPISFYALSKLSAERYAQLYDNLFGFKSCILRFSNVYGPLQAGGVVTSILNSLIEGKNPIIFDGNQTRDFIYVKDVAEACIHSLLSDKTGVFNISSSTEISIQKVYEEISKLTGIKLEPIYKALREGEIEKSVLSNTKAILSLGWSPTYSLVDGLNETIQHYINLKQT